LAPLVGAPATKHSLRVFVDHAVVEAQLNGRALITQGFFPAAPSDATGLELWAGDGTGQVVIDTVEIWGMTSTWVG